MTDKQYVTPRSVDGGVLDDTAISEWREQGFTFTRGLMPTEVVDALATAARKEYPLPGSEEAKSFLGFGSKGAMAFPSPIPSFNAVTLDEHLLRAVAALLGVDPMDIRLTQSDLWPKYGRERLGVQDASDQRIHVDYPNHTMVHPSPWDRPDAVELILYLDRWEEVGGSTAVVPRQGKDDPAYRWPIVDTPGVGKLKFVNDREAAEAYFASERPELADWRQLLYNREKLTMFEPGDVIFYRHDTWHRGTPMTDGALRLAHNMTFRRADAEWIDTLHIGWAWASYAGSKYLSTLLAESSVLQRTVMGFPAPGSRYWCPETCDAIEARYGEFGIDMTPYRDAL